ncbi:hypothetical protein CEXT_192291 [Caerostris extrusa]|uniref:Uncharacterized protein n=1 Tax=Caerostris extrusa TaxID=172846 RepID=A0AAV4TWU2_CAEEX|nr:hypothetical protein CEXT_192291 [Caerostris extrusa]
MRADRDPKMQIGKRQRAALIFLMTRNPFSSLPKDVSMAIDNAFLFESSSFVFLLNGEIFRERQKVLKMVLVLIKNNRNPLFEGNEEY